VPLFLFQNPTTSGHLPTRRLDAWPFIHKVHHYTRLRIFAKLLAKPGALHQWAQRNQQGIQGLKWEAQVHKLLKNAICAGSEFRIHSWVRPKFPKFRKHQEVPIWICLDLMGEK
jgi:hypothetical protein